MHLELEHYRLQEYWLLTNRALVQYLAQDQERLTEFVILHLNYCNLTNLVVVNL